MKRPVDNRLIVHLVNPRTSASTWGYLRDKYLQIPLDFYYNKENCNIIYGSRMVYHYRQHPPHEKYVHVPNFVEDLYGLYQRSRKGESTTQDDNALCCAITSLLTKIYPSQLSDEGQSSTTQLAFILPSQEYTNKVFIDTTLLPLLQNTPWLTPDDTASKVVFYSRIDTYAYQLNDTIQHGFCLERERKYLFFTLKKTHSPNRLLLIVTFTRAVYDPDLIAASGRSMTALGGSTMLSLKMISPTLLLEIPIEPRLAKMERLAEILYHKAFAGEENESSPTVLEKYNTDTSYESLLHRLIYGILTLNLENTWSAKINTDEFIDVIPPDMLSKNNKSRLSLLTYGDIMQLFDDIDMSSVENEIGHYLQKYGDDELFQNIVIVERDDDVELDDMKINPYTAHNLFFAEKQCQRFYLSRVNRAIICFLERQKKCKSTRRASISSDDITGGCAYKVLKMVQLSDKLRRPVVLQPVGESKQDSSKAPAIQKEKLALIDQIQPYGYYVEANIGCSNEINMSLNQVIETTTEDGKLQRSTISIMDSSYQTSDMYDSIFDALWIIINGHMANRQCKSSQEYESIDFYSYKRIRATLIDATKNSMEKKQCDIQNLDEVIYQVNAKPNCTCDLMITHRHVMNTGLLSYLKGIAGEMVASLKANAIFGNYKISCLFVTGEFLYKWLEQGNSTYGEFIWSHLQQEISSALNEKQPRIHLIMKKSIILQDSILNYKPFKLEKYKQIFSKHYFLEISLDEQRDFRVYRDAGNHWVEVAAIDEDTECWRIPILPMDQNESCRPVCKEKLYFIINPKDIDRVSGDIGLYALSTDQLDNLDTAISLMNVASIVYIDPLRTSQGQCTFPLEVDIFPCSYLSACNMNMRLGVGLDWSDPLGCEHVAYSERLTLQEINSE